jgi:hypothetical protein
VAREKRGKPDEGIQLKEESYGLIQTNILFRADGSGIVEINVRRESRFYQQEKEK